MGKRLISTLAIRFTGVDTGINLPIETLFYEHPPARKNPQTGRSAWIGYRPRCGTLLPADALLASGEEKKPYECDGLSAYRQLPGLVALPETVEQVRRVIRACREHGVPVVTRGAGTGLSGGALPHADGVLLSLSKLSRILEIDPINRTARVEPGVRNLAISEAVAPHGLYYAPDPRRRSPAPSAATSPGTPAACIA